MSNPMSGLGPGIVTVLMRPKPPEARAGTLPKVRNTPSSGTVKRSLHLMTPLPSGRKAPYVPDQMLVVRDAPGQLECHLSGEGRSGRKTDANRGEPTVGLLGYVPPPPWAPHVGPPEGFTGREFRGQAGP